MELVKYEPGLIPQAPESVKADELTTAMLRLVAAIGDLVEAFRHIGERAASASAAMTAVAEEAGRRGRRG